MFPSRAERLRKASAARGRKLRKREGFSLPTVDRVCRHCGLKWKGHADDADAKCLRCGRG